MGDRIQLRFCYGVETSPWLYYHWGGGDGLPEKAAAFARQRYAPEATCTGPLERGEPDAYAAYFAASHPPSRIRMMPFTGSLDRGSWEIDCVAGEARPLDHEARTSEEVSA